MSIIKLFLALFIIFWAVLESWLSSLPLEIAWKKHWEISQNDPKRYLEAWAKGSFCENLPGTNLLANFTLCFQKLITNLLLFVSCMGGYAFKGETTEWCNFHLVPPFDECSPGVVGNLINLGGNMISYFSSVPGLNFS